MSTIRPLAAIRYDTSRGRDLSRKLAPPYDILDQTDKDRLLAGDPRNFVKIDLPYIPPKEAGPEVVYRAARQELDAWLADGTLVRDATPAIYVYHQAYECGGAQYIRKMFFARLRVEPFGAGSVFPHERTFGGPKEDRLALTKATQANLSPIFGLYEDAHNRLARRLEQALTPEPLAVGTLDGVENRLWAVTDAATIADVTQMMASLPIYIADGHHRYGTALMYRDWLREQHGGLPADHPANFVLCVFCAMEDPGLLILPTHRVLPGTPLTPATFAADRAVQVQPLAATEPAAAVAALAPLGPQAVGVWSAASPTYWALRPADPDILRPLEPARSEPWRRLGLAFLHAYVLDRLVTPQVCGGRAPEIHYVKSDEAAVREAQQTGGSVFLLQPTTMEELRAVCQANDLMPQKSTYFYPKLASGLVINPLFE